MGMSAGGGGGKKRAVADINVTPMVDVMLVLLVIFMITAPSIKQIEGMEVNLPVLGAESVAESLLIEDAWTIPITADGQIGKNGSKSDDDIYRSPADGGLADLVIDLKNYKKESEAALKKPAVVIAGDKDSKYQLVMQVWNAVKESGIRNISFQVDGGSDDEKKPATKKAAGDKPVEAKK
jgi:biopolymer transport protein TolR